jgi:leucine dehydrogenase
MPSTSISLPPGVVTRGPMGANPSALATALRLGHEEVSFHHQPAADYLAVIAIHSSVLGPAVGGTRLLSYPSVDDALLDALRLSRGMTYKNAAAGLPFGGAKAVILGDSRRPDRERVFRTHGRVVERFGGRFITAEDVGTSDQDVATIGRETRHVRGFGDLGPPSPWTARGVCRAIQAAARERWGTDSLAGRTVAVQGCGQVGRELARLLAAAGARLVVSEADPRLLAEVVRELGATAVEAEAIYDARADVFAPCALGAVLDDRTIPRLTVEIVAGAANNQLLDDRHGRLLEESGILYAPDFIANAGGVISSAADLLGWERARVVERIDGIYDTMLAVFARARRDGVPTSEAADRLAESRLAQGRA